MVRTALASLAAAAALAPAAAFACPQCAGRDDGPSALGLTALGIFVFLPFVITFVVARVIRRAEQ